MSSSYGKYVRTTIFGQSHSAAIGVVIDGLPAGQQIDLEEVKVFMERRAPGRSKVSTSRREDDIPEVVSGLVDGVTCGAPLCAMIYNTNTHSQDYQAQQTIPRPSHADYTAVMKHHNFNDVRGGGHFSGRLTAPLCFAGAIYLQFLKQSGIEIAAHVYSIAGVRDEDMDPVSPDLSRLRAAAKKEIPAVSDAAAADMKAAILAAREQGDSVGGVIECVITGMPGGIGDPIFEGIENRIAAGMFGIPAVRGIEFGMGFAAAKMTGSAHNDPFCMDEEGRIRTATNHHGGILGGITSGMPIVFRVAIKPTPSIAQTQSSVDLVSKKAVETKITGRHDPCIVPRAVPCVEACAAMVLLDSLLEGKE